LPQVFQGLVVLAEGDVGASLAAGTWQGHDLGMDASASLRLPSAQNRA
jgi:hypothetical protein